MTRTRTLGVLICALSLVGAALALSRPAPAGAATAGAATAGRCVDAVHRGYQAHAVENSMRAMRAGVYRHADYLEMDVQVTRDGQVVLMHDKTIDRTTDGTGRVIDQTRAELSRVRLNDGQRVPTLRSVLAMAKPSGTGVLVELKWIPQSRFPAVERMLADYGLARVVVNSFSPWVTQRFHELYPEVRTALDVQRPISVARARRYGGVMPDHRHVSNAWLASMREAGLSTYVWKVDTAAAWHRFAGRATMVITDRAAGYDTWRRKAC